MSQDLAHFQRDEIGVTTAEWASYTLKTAFQPIFAFGRGKLKIAAFECLIRPFRGGEPIAPGEFFKMIPAQDRFAAETVSRTLHLMNAGRFIGPESLVFLNFDPSHYCDKALADMSLREMLKVVQKVNLSPRQLVCEMTEQISHSEPALFSFVESLRGYGFRIAVDDYGADHSDIRRVEQLNPDIVKFDAHWITKLMESGPGLGLLKAMVERFRAKGIQTVFEGIEESWQLDLAETAGASMVQGYVLARPQLAPTDFDLFREKRSSPGFSEPGNKTVETVAPSFGTEVAPTSPDNISVKSTAPVRGRIFGRRQAL